MTTLRSGVCKVAWLARETRPDLLADVCLLQQAFPKPQQKHVKLFNTLVNRAVMSADQVKLRISKTSRTKFVVCSDTAWGNAEGFKSQAGYFFGNR